MVTFLYMLGCTVMPTLFALLYVFLYINWKECYCDDVPDYIGAAPADPGGWFVSASSVPIDRSVMIPTGYAVIDSLAWMGHSIRLTALYLLWGAECYMLHYWRPEVCMPIDTLLQ